VYFNSDKDCST